MPGKLRGTFHARLLVHPWGPVGSRGGPRAEHRPGAACPRAVTITCLQRTRAVERVQAFSQLVRRSRGEEHGAFHGAPGADAHTAPTAGAPAPVGVDTGPRTRLTHPACLGGPEQRDRLSNATAGPPSGAGLSQEDLLVRPWSRAIAEDHEAHQPPAGHERCSDHATSATRRSRYR